MSFEWSRQGIVGPLAAFAPGFAEELARQKYASGSIYNQIRFVRQLSRWLLVQGLGVADLRMDVVDRFLSARRASGYKKFRSIKAIRPVLSYLRGMSMAPPPATAIVSGPVDLLLERYRRHLLVERAVATFTARLYTDEARSFLDRRLAADGEALNLADLSTADVASYVVERCSLRGHGAAKHTVKVLRSFLRFLQLDGTIEGSLAAAIPAVSNRQLAGLPKGLTPEQVCRLLATCDISTPVGRRDLAVLTILVRLGLRSIEVVRLRLDDVDWRAGEITVRGKRNRTDRLPLPSDVGDALVEYLRQSCLADAQARNVFIGAIAPYRPLDPGGVASLVVRAARRSGVGKVSPHRLRHTAATEMLRAGASLREIGQVLRHSRAMTTAIYAKVDHTALRTIARQWPGDVA